MLAGRWRGGDLSWGLWERLKRHLDLVEQLELRGWGEPLLHPELRAMVEDARAAGCAVSVATNGDLMDAAADWIVAAGVTRVSLTVAGGAVRHAGLRGGLTVDGVWRAVARLTEARGRRHLPRVEVLYLLTADNAHDLPGAIDRAAAAGADGVRVGHLDCTPSFGLLEEAAHFGTELRPGIAEELGVALSVARSAGIDCSLPPRGGDRLTACARNPLLSLFVGWDGRIGPCSYLMIPIEGQIPRCTFGEATAVEPVVFGTLEADDVKDVIAGARRTRFIHAFASRAAAERAAQAAGRWDPHSGGPDGAELPPLPAECVSCHKALGW